MLDEEMDNMIRQAAEQHHPSYDNKAWDKMEQLLDQHLPQRRNRRGFIFYLLLALLIGGGLFVGGYFYFGNKKEPVASVEPKKETNTQQSTSTIPNTVSPTVPNTPSVPTANDNTDIVKDNINTAKDNANTVKDKTSTTTVNTNTTKDNTSITKKPANLPANRFAVGKRAAKTSVSINPGVATEDETVVAKGNPKNDKPIQEKNPFGNEVAAIATEFIANADKKNITTDVKKNAVENIPEVQPTVKKPVDTDLTKETAKEKAPETVSKKTNNSVDKKKTKQSIAGNFGLSFSAGPDISLVDLKKPGKITLSYGVGLSYTFIKKLTLQTGIYVSRKLYSADSTNYKAPAGFWSAYPNMDNNVDANCKVYEVPVNLLYNFGQKKKHNWFGGAGLSTYFMKTETYDYSYSYMGQVYPQSYSIENENQHNFSVLTLTAGYQYNISPKLSISAQPYVKLPLNGIGFGKVQLKGGGAMLNVTVKPFGKKQ